jgi:hypothetical protein
MIVVLHLILLFLSSSSSRSSDSLSSAHSSKRRKCRRKHGKKYSLGKVSTISKKEWIRTYVLLKRMKRAAGRLTFKVQMDKVLDNSAMCKEFIFIDKMLENMHRSKIYRVSKRVEKRRVVLFLGLSHCGILLMHMREKSC